MDPPEEAGEFEHGTLTRSDSETTPLLGGVNQAVGSLSEEATDGGAGVTMNPAVASTDDTERDIRAYELTVAFDPVGGGLR